MAVVTWIATALLVLRGAHCYILLTANLEDVQALGKQLADSPVVEQIQGMWRRASDQFSRHVTKDAGSGWSRKRANENSDGGKPEDGAAGGDPRRSSHDDDLVALGREASVYLKSIKKMFETA